MSDVGLTTRQAQCLSIIETRIKQTGLCPSFDEIAGGLGIRSKSNVNRLLNGLEERGKIRRLPGRARSIALIETDVARINPEIARLVKSYQAEEKIDKFDTAVNELLRFQLGAA